MSVLPTKNNSIEVIYLKGRVLSGFSTTEKALCLYFLHRKLKGDSNTFSLGQKKLVKIIGRHENSVSRALNSLEKKGWVTREQVGKQYNITFTPPLRYLQQLICFSSKAALYSLASENQREELLKINTNLKLERDFLREELEQQLNQKSKTEKIISNITYDQISIFVDDLLETINDVFDSRTLDKKIAATIINFQTKLGLQEATAAIKEQVESKDPFPNFGFWNPSGVSEGFKLQKQISDD